MRVLKFAILLIHFHVFQACEKYRFVKEDDEELQDHVITTMTTPYVEICWDKCVWIMNCFSINVRNNSFGTIDCDLNNSSKTARPGSMVSRQGSQYHQMEEVQDSCKKYECKSKQDFGDEGFLLRNQVVQMFSENKTWMDARTHCQSLGGDLLSISTSYENDFIYDMLKRKIDLPTQIRQQTDYVLPSLFKYWPLDGHDADVSLKGDPGAARYEAIEGEKALYLSGLRSYAEVPAFIFNPEGFTFMLWIKPLLGRDGLYAAVFSNWETDNFIFKLYISPLNGDVSFEITREDGVNVIITYLSIKMNQWNHIAVSWNATEKQAMIVMDGENEKKKTSGNPGNSPNIKATSSTHYQLGIFKFYYEPASAPKNTFMGHMKHLMVFNKALNKQEIQRAMYWPEQAPWVGLNAINQTSIFKWSDESKTEFIALPSGAPVQGQECVAFKNNGQWFARNCQETRPFICEKPAP